MSFCALILLLHIQYKSFQSSTDWLNSTTDYFSVIALKKIETTDTLVVVFLHTTQLSLSHLRCAIEKAGVTQGGRSNSVLWGLDRISITRDTREKTEHFANDSTC